MKLFHLFIINFASVLSANGGITYYGSLIKSISDKYVTSGVVIVSSVKYQSFDRLEIWLETTKHLSEGQISSAIVNFHKFHEKWNYTTGKTVRPLFVISMSTMQDIYAFQLMTTDLDMNYPIWLLIFASETQPDICQFCKNPPGNVFHLTFKTEMLVSCCWDREIFEWWSRPGNKTHLAKLATWIGGEKALEWETDMSLYSRRHFSDRREVRVVIIGSSGWIWEKNDTFSGFLGDILLELSHAMNFTVSTLIKDNIYGSYDARYSNWTGVIGKIRDNQADMGASEFSMTRHRLDAVDFTLPIAIGQCGLFIRKPDSVRLRWNAHFKAFEAAVWMHIIGLVLIVPVILTMIRWNKKYPLFPMIIEHFLDVFGIYCQQGISEFPRETPLRLVYVSIFISALVVSAAYSASLISFLSSASSYLPFRTMEEFVEDGTYKLIVFQDSSDYDMFKESNDIIMKRMMSLMKPRLALPTSLKDGFRQVCQERVAFYSNMALKKAANNHEVPCDMVFIETGRIDTLGMVMPYHSEYTGIINYNIQRFLDNGMVSRLKEKYFEDNKPSEEAHPSVDLGGIAPILCVLAVGYLLGIIIYLIEIIIHSVRSEKFKLRENNKKLAKSLIVVRKIGRWR